MSKFKELSEINVNKKTEKKGKFTYLSWSFAWGELMKVAPDSTSKVYHNELDGMPYFSSDMGVIVKVGVTVDGIEHISYLPVMDMRNNAVMLADVDMMGINKAIQRCTTKAIALHGLGLYIYAGEDLPEAPKTKLTTEGLDYLLSDKGTPEQINKALKDRDVTTEQINKLKAALK